MDEIQVEQKSYEMPPREGFTVTHFITVADIDRCRKIWPLGGRAGSGQPEIYQPFVNPNAWGSLILDGLS